MAKLLYIQEADHKGFLVLGLLSGEEKRRLTVTRGDYLEAGAPARGDDLDEDTVAVLLAASERFEVMRSALRILACADNSERALIQKLRHKGFSAEASEDAAREMVRLGYINEERQLEALVRAEAKGKLHGPRRIVAEAGAKGYSASSVRRAVRALTESGEIDFAEQFETLLDKKGVDRSDEDEVRKWKYRFGY